MKKKAVQRPCRWSANPGLSEISLRAPRWTSASNTYKPSRVLWWSTWKATIPPPSMTEYFEKPTFPSQRKSWSSPSLKSSRCHQLTHTIDQKTRRIMLRHIKLIWACRGTHIRSCLEFSLLLLQGPQDDGLAALSLTSLIPSPSYGDNSILSSREAFDNEG